MFVSIKLAVKQHWDYVANICNTSKDDIKKFIRGDYNDVDKEHLANVHRLLVDTISFPSAREMREFLETKVGEKTVIEMIKEEMYDEVESFYKEEYGEE